MQHRPNCKTGYGQNLPKPVLKKTVKPIMVRDHPRSVGPRFTGFVGAQNLGFGLLATAKKPANCTSAPAI